MRPFSFTFERELCNLRCAFAFLFLLEALALCPRTGASRHILDAESPDVPPASAYVPLVEILTPLCLVRTYKVDRSFFPDSPPSAPPENVPSFGNPKVAKAPAHLRESWKDADELWAKAAAETVAQWNELERSSTNAKKFSGILVDWSSNDCGLATTLPNWPTAWVAFIPFSPSSSTTRRSCSLRVHILAAQKSGAVAAVVYDDEDTDVSRGSPSETLAREKGEQEQNPVKPTRRDENLNLGDEEEEIELAVAALRNSEAVRLLFDVLRERKDWIVIDVTTFVLEPDAVEAIPRTVKTEYPENGNVFPSSREPEQFSSKGGQSSALPFSALSPEEFTRMRERKSQDGSFPNSIIAGAFNLLTSIVIVFSAFCMLQLLSNSTASWPLHNRYISLLFSRIPFSAFWFTAEDQLEAVDSDDETEDRKYEKRNIHKLVLESFEIRRYSSAVVVKEASRFAGETPPKIEHGESEVCKPTERPSSSEHEHVPGSAEKERNDGPKRPEAISVAAFPLEEKRRPTCLSSPRLDQRRTFPAHRMVPASGSVLSSQRSHSFSHPQSSPEQSVSGTNGGRPRAPPSLPTTSVQSNRSFTQPHISPFGQRGYVCTGPCPICLDDYEDGQTIRRLPCGHEYHVTCIDPWLLNSASYCPMCKTDYLEWPIPKVPNDTTSGVPDKIANFFAALFEPHSPTGSNIGPRSTQTDRRV